MFSDFSSKYTKDERFKAVEKPRDREQYFHEFVAEIRKKEKEEKAKEKEKVGCEYEHRLNSWVRPFGLCSAILCSVGKSNKIERDWTMLDGLGITGLL